MTNHTPGPWKWQTDGKGHFHITEANGEIGNMFIADIIPGMGKEQEWANRDLITAAPDMLDALKVALAFCDITKNYSPDGDDVRKFIQKAIDKAEGRAGE